MSIEALSHVLSLENVGDSTRKLVLIGLANHAHKDGTAAWSGTDLLARYANCSGRTVTRHIGALLDSGHIREGDQGLVGHIRGDRRPIVYDVALSEEARLAWAAERAAGETGRRGLFVAAGQRAAKSSPGTTGQNGTPSAERGDTGDVHGVTPVTPRGDTGVTQTVLEPSLEPSDSSLRSESAGGVIEALSDQPGLPLDGVPAALDTKPVNTAQAVETSEGAKPVDVAGDIATAYYEWFQAKVGPVIERGKSRPYIMVRDSLVKPALAAGYTPEEVRLALANLATRTQRFAAGWGPYEAALVEVRTGRAAQGNRPAPANRHHDTDDAAAAQHRAAVSAAWGEPA